MPFSLDPQPADDEIECAQCGALVYHELTRCPKCGVNLYEPEADADEPAPPPRAEDSTGPLAGLGRLVRRLLGEPHPADELFSGQLQQQALYADLVRRVGGDRAAADRLVDFEREQRPRANRTVWLQNALRRWERDNR